MRYGVSDITVTVSEHGQELLVRWDVRGGADVFEDMKAAFRAAFVPGARWSPDDRAWILPRSLDTKLRLWLMGKVKREAIAWSADAGTERPHAPRAAIRGVADAAAVPHLRSDAPLWACEAVYKAAVKRAHPDVVGSEGHAHMVVLNQAIEVLREAHAAVDAAAS